MFFFILLFAYCALSVLYLFLLSCWGKLFFTPGKWSDPPSSPPKRIAIFVPAYKEDNVILFTADNHFLDTALIYDEKVDSSAAFGQQRKRWISSQLIYSRKFFFPAFRQLFSGNISYFNLAIANYTILPKAFLLAMLPLLILAGFLIQPAWGLAATTLFIIYLISLELALPRSLINMDLLRAIVSLPRVVSLMFGALLQSRKTDEAFIHTPHTKTGITNPAKER